MSGIRRALIFSSAERYINLVVNFALIAAVSRLLTPEEVGVSVLGVTILGFVEILRDIPSSYLIQQKDLTPKDVRTGFTAMLLISVALAAVLIAASGWVAEIYKNDKLIPYLYVLALAFLPGPFERPTMALLRRDMEFQKIAVVNVATCLVSALVTVTLALLGFSFMSFAWGMVATGVTAAVGSNAYRREWSNFIPLLSEWRKAVRFGGYTTASAVLGQAYELMPYLLLSRIYNFDVVGLYSRVLLVSQLPDKLLLSSLVPVAFPALAAKARAGESLKQPYLRAMSYLTVVQWPTLLVLAVLADPIVKVMLGSQWTSIVPLVQITCIAMLLSFPAYITYVTFLAVGALKDLLMASIVNRPICAIVVAIAAYFGLKALVCSLFLTLAFNGYVTQCFMRRHVPFTWLEFGGAIRKSGVVALCSVLPSLVIVAVGGSFAISIPWAIVGGLLAGIGWIVGLWLTQHPLLDEVLMITGAIRKSERGILAAARFLKLLQPLRSLFGFRA